MQTLTLWLPATGEVHKTTLQRVSLHKRRRVNGQSHCKRYNLTLGFNSNTTLQGKTAGINLCEPFVLSSPLLLNITPKCWLIFAFFLKQDTGNSQSSVVALHSASTTNCGGAWPCHMTINRCPLSTLQDLFHSFYPLLKKKFALTKIINLHWTAEDLLMCFRGFLWYWTEHKVKHCSLKREKREGKFSEFSWGGGGGD